MSRSETRQRRSRSSRSRVSDAPTESGPGSIYDDPTDRDSLVDRPPLPIKPPGSIDVDSRQPGNSADDYFNEITTTPSDETPPTNALSRRRTSSHGLSMSHSPSHARSSRRTRSHSSARDILRMLISAEGSESREALALLRKTSERLELENQRANEAERRVQEANERWRVINQARVQAQADASRVNEELRLYKLQLEAAQQQIARANDMISQTDKEKAQAEDEAAKAKRLAKKYEIEAMVQKAREEGRRLGREQGMKEGREIGMYDGLRMYDSRPYASRDRDMYNNDANYADDDTYAYDDLEDEVPVMQQGGPPIDAQEFQGRQPLPRSIPNGVPPEARQEPASTTSRGPRRSGGMLNSISRFARPSREPGIDRNVAVNPSNAPDVATIIDDEPYNPLASPLPPEQTSQVNHTTPTRMPVPNFNPNPSEVPPISVPGSGSRPRSLAHPPNNVPPEGFIPRLDDDGSIRLPPPHEMGRAPPTPHTSNSPLPNAANLPPSVPTELPEREREPIGRDFGYTAPQQTRSQGRHRYQKSVAESDDSIAALSIISPPGASRPSALQPRLSAIPENDGRYASPSGSMRQGDGPVYPGTPRSSRRPAPVSDPVFENRLSMMDEGPVVPTEVGMTFSPRSTRTGYSGPRRPSRLTTPAPLAQSLASEGLGQPYTRPRINSVASGSDAGFVNIPRPARSREKTPAPDYSRSRAGSVPDINIVPASRSESLQSRRSHDMRDAVSPRMSPYNSQLEQVPEQMQMPIPTLPTASENCPPAPVSIPGMPEGFVPVTPEGAPAGFVPSAPLDGPPPGFVPVSPAIPSNVPPGFVPLTPVVLPDVPLGFIAMSPAPAPPPGFIPTSPAPPGMAPMTPVPGGPPGFMAASPMAQDRAMPTSTMVPTSPLPQPNFPQRFPGASPSMSMTGALPVLARSTNDMSQVANHYSRNGTATPRSPRVSFSGPNAGFHSRAASEWDTHSAWGDARSEHSPRPIPVRGPDLRSPRMTAEEAIGVEIYRPGSTSPVDPDPVTFQPSRSAIASRRGSRVGFDDPAAVPLPASTAPSMIRSGRASSHGSVRANSRGPGLTRSQSARSDTSRTRGVAIYPYSATGTPARLAQDGLPPMGLSSPHSRRLDPHLESQYEGEEDPREFEIVPSDDSSQNTLTTPPARKRDLPRGIRGTPAPSRKSLAPVSPAGSQRRASLFVPPDPADDPTRLSPRLRPLDPEPSSSLRRSASRQSIGSNKSYARFDPSDYVDPAILTSGRSRLLPLPQEEAPAPTPVPAATKGKKGKGRKKK